jgi:hypothetical protein
MGKRDRLIASDKELKLFASKLSRFLQSNLQKVLGPLDAKDSAQAAQVLGSLQTIVQEMGLTKEMGELTNIYGKDLAAIVDRFDELQKNRAGVRVGPKGGVTVRKRGEIISDINRPMVETLIKGGFNQAAGHVTRLIGDMREQVALSVLTGVKPDISALLDAETEALESRLNTELGTTFAAFHRTVTLATAEDLGFELFEYIGPDDQVTRKFCYELLERDPPIYSIEEIRRMDNGQDLPVEQFGGGYNCRHIWGPVSEEEAREQGWKP